MLREKVLRTHETRLGKTRVALLRALVLRCGSDSPKEKGDKCQKERHYFLLFVMKEESDRDAFLCVCRGRRGHRVEGGDGLLVWMGGWVGISLMSSPWAPLMLPFSSFFLALFFSGPTIIIHAWFIYCLLSSSFITYIHPFTYTPRHTHIRTEK